MRAPVMKAAMSSRPWNQASIGGIEKLASSRSSATIAATSARFQASTKAPTSSRARSSPSARSVACCDGRRRSSVARARCSALLTAATDASRISAVSDALKPSTSRSSSAAR